MLVFFAILGTCIISLVVAGTLCLLRLLWVEFRKL